MMSARTNRRCGHRAAPPGVTEPLHYRLLYWSNSNSACADWKDVSQAIFSRVYMARATPRRRSRRWEVHGRAPQICGRSWGNLAGAIQHLSPSPGRPVPPLIPSPGPGPSKTRKLISARSPTSTFSVPLCSVPMSPDPCLSLHSPWSPDFSLCPESSPYSVMLR